MSSNTLDDQDTVISLLRVGEQNTMIPSHPRSPTLGEISYTLAEITEIKLEIAN